MSDHNAMGNLYGKVVKTGAGPLQSGGTATIWSGHWIRDPSGEKLAIKIAILNQRIPREKMERRLAEEMAVWQRLSHKNILKLYGWISDPAQADGLPASVSPWCNHGSLEDLLQTMQGQLDRLLRYSIIRDFTDGLHYMHTAPRGPVMHGDLKSANILIADGFVAKIADFGLSRAIKKQQSEQISTMTIVGPGTLRWMTPEALRKYTEGQELERPSSATDVWAWAHLVYETVTGKIPYSQYPGDFPAVTAIINGKRNPRPIEGDINTDLFLSALFWPILERCWAYDPRERPRITQVVQESAFADISPRHNDGSLRLHEDPARFDSASRYKRQGEIAYKKAMYNQALDYYDKARQILELIGDLVRHASCLRDLGWTLIALHDHDSARTRFMNAREIFVRIGDLRGQLGVIQDLAINERSAGNLVQAREHLEFAYNGCRDAGLYIRSGWCLVATGLLDVDVKNWDAAHLSFKTAAEIAIREQDQGLFGRSRERQGDCYLRQEKRAKARQCYDDAARAYRSLGREEDQVARVEEKIQNCHFIHYQDITSMPLWGTENFRTMDDGSDAPNTSGRVTV